MNNNKIIYNETYNHFQLPFPLSFEIPGYLLTLAKLCNLSLDWDLNPNTIILDSLPVYFSLLG